jgi:hypothetical protein
MEEIVVNQRSWFSRHGFPDFLTNGSCARYGSPSFSNKPTLLADNGHGTKVKLWNNNGKHGMSASLILAAALASYLQQGRLLKSIRGRMIFIGEAPLARLILAVLFAASALQAASMVFSSCTAGSATIAPCSTDPNLMTGLSGPDYFVGAYAAVTEFSATNLQGFGGTPAIPGGYGLDAVANAVSVVTDTSAPLLSATAQASDTGTYTSVGLPRSGSIEFDIGLGYLHEDAEGVATVAITDGTHTYTYAGGGGVFGSTPPVHCEMEDCLYTATLPFQIGTTFQIAVAASAGAGPGSSGGGHDGEAEVLFNIFDTNGASVPFAAVPEPSPWALLSLAMLSAGWFARRRPRRADITALSLRRSSRQT